MMKGGGELGLRMNNFYVEINSSVMHTMNIPNKFAKIASMSEIIELEGPSGYTWHVKIERSQSDNTFALQSGWKEFVTANKIYENDILVFTFKDNSSFKVLIFDRSGCEKLAPFFAKNMNTEPGKESTRVIASLHQQVEKEIISLSSGSSDTDERISGKKKQKVADFVQESSEGDSESDDGTVRKIKTKKNRWGLPTAARTSRGTTTGNLSNGPTSFSTSTGTTADGHEKFEKVNLGNAQKGGSRIKSGPGTSAGTYVPPLKFNMRKRKFVIEEEEKSDDSTDSSDGEDEIVLKPKSMEKSKEDKREEREDHARSEGDYMAYEWPAPEFYNLGNDRSIEKFKPGETWALYYDTDMDDDYDDVDDEKEEDLNSEPKEYTYPDPEFFQFDNLRDPTKFAVDQVWAVYDDRDRMPRFYARIKAVRTVPTFEIDIVWFEPDTDPFTPAWTHKGLPVATGAFKLGKTQCVDELLMFSHALSCNKIGKRNAFYIYPKRGQIWALFKDWNFNWCSESGKKKKFDYEVVEVVSDLTDSTGFVVMPLVKINGFVSLFMQSTEATPVVIPKDEILRFSHNVLWYRTTGKEREGVLQGAFELDSVSLPPDLDKAFSCIDLYPKLNEKSKEVKKEEREDHARLDKISSKEEKKEEREDHARSDKISSKEEKKEEREGHARSDKISSKEEEREERENHARSEGHYMAFECPASEFYNFGNDGSIEKFKPNQTWALYCDIDNLPKYYAVVKQVDPEGKTVNVMWLEPYRKDASVEEKRWIDTDLPLGCGTFILGSTARYNHTDVFSHEVVTLPVSGKKNVFEIVPVKTETWAVYKNWKIGWSMDDITKRCQYDLVRVSNVTRSWIEVLYLTKVADHRSVFKLDHEKKVMRIPRGEFVRFSHKIPAHRLSDKAGPNLSGCWELDPAALPESLLF